MANAAPKFLFLFFLSLLSNCSSGTLVGFSYHSSGNTTPSSPGRTISFLKQNKITPSQIRVIIEDPRILSTLSNTGVAIDLYLNESHVENMMNSKSSSISWLQTHIMPFLSQVKIKSIVAISRNDYTRKYTLSMLLSTLKSIRSFLTSLPVNSRIEVSVAFSLSFLENLRRGHGRNLHMICNYIKEVRSFVIVEANIDGELSMGDRFVLSTIETASLANSLLPCNDVPMVLTIKSSAVPSATEVAEFTDKVSKALANNIQITGRIVGLYAHVASMEEFAQKELRREEEQIFPSSRRELLKTTLHETFNTPTIFPTTPITPYNPTPTIVTVPSTNPVTTTPVNPAAPVAIPSTTPITLPPINPLSTPLPVSNPVTSPITVPGAQPITNPVTTYPAPSGGVPVTTPVTNPLPPPATTNAPAVPGQSWCVAKSGAQETALQAALDYACGMGGSDCSQIQQGGSCYNPISLQNHASYAFNSYYQKNPVPTSCDFGGVATIVATNPSTGSCIYPSSSSSSTPTSTTPTPTPASTNPTPTPAPTTPTTPTNPATTPTTPTNPATTPTTGTPPITSLSPPGEGVSGSGTPPSVLNSSNPASGTMPEIGMDNPPGYNTSTSTSASLRPFIGSIFLLTTLVTRNLVLSV